MNLKKWTKRIATRKLLRLVEEAKRGDTIRIDENEIYYELREAFRGERKMKNSEIIKEHFKKQLKPDWWGWEISSGKKVKKYGIKITEERIILSRTKGE